MAENLAPINDASLVAMRLNDGVIGYEAATDSYVITTSKPVGDEDRAKLAGMVDKPVRFEEFR